MFGPAQTFLQAAHNAFITMDADGRVAFWNPRAEEIFGYSQEEALGEVLAELIIPPDYRQRHRAALERFLSTGTGPMLNRRMHLSALRRDGAELPVDITITASEVDGAWVFNAWLQDMSERTELLGELEAYLRGGQPGFAEILDALAEAVTIRDSHHHIVYANRAALKQMGFSSLEELQRRPPRSIFSDYVVEDEHGDPLTMQDVPSVRLLEGKPSEPLLMRTISRATGAVRWNLLKSTALRDASGKPAAAVTIIEDLTSVKTREVRDRFLATVSDVLAGSLDYQQTLRNVAWLAVPEVADWCAVDLVDERGAREQVVAAHRDPAKLALAERLREFEPQELDPEQGIGRVMRTGAAQLWSDIPDHLLVQGALNEDHLELLRALEMRSVVLVPLRTPTRTLGVMTLVNAESRRCFTEEDRDFALQLASRAAVAVENARLATARHEIAQTLQRSLLPDAVPTIAGWQVATMYRPAGASQEVEVGGDFFDFFPTADGWIVILGDVVGKGVEAAAMTSLVRHGARFVSQVHTSPAAILGRLDEALRQQPALSLCTALCLLLRDDDVVVSSAGHPDPLIIRQGGVLRALDCSGPILGAWPDGQWPEQVLRVDRNDTLFMYTDGVTDTRGEDSRFGQRRLIDLLRENADLAPAELLEKLGTMLNEFQLGAQDDDTAALALRLEPVHAATPAVTEQHESSLA